MNFLKLLTLVALIIKLFAADMISMEVALLLQHPEDHLTVVLPNFGMPEN